MRMCWSIVRCMLKHMHAESWRLCLFYWLTCVGFNTVQSPSEPAQVNVHMTSWVSTMNCRSVGLHFHALSDCDSICQAAKLDTMSTWPSQDTEAWNPHLPMTTPSPDFTMHKSPLEHFSHWLKRASRPVAKTTSTQPSGTLNSCCSRACRCFLQGRASVRDTSKAPIPSRWHKWKQVTSRSTEASQFHLVFLTSFAKRLGNLCSVPYKHLRANETVLELVCRLLLEKKKKHVLRSRQQ